MSKSLYLGRYGADAVMCVADFCCWSLAREDGWGVVRSFTCVSHWVQLEFTEP